MIIQFLPVAIAVAAASATPPSSAPAIRVTSSVTCLANSWLRAARMSGQVSKRYLSR